MFLALSIMPSNTTYYITLHTNMLLAALLKRKNKTSLTGKLAAILICQRLWQAQCDNSLSSGKNKLS